MRYRAGWAVVIFFLFISLTVTAIAHPGDTDSTGGHWDSSTGSYHYHHGYPAHSHRDTDGDGYADCPYDFHDQTGVNSGTSGGSGESSSEGNSTGKLATSNESLSSTEMTVKGVLYSIGFFLALLLVSSMIGTFLYFVAFLMIRSVVEWAGYHLTKSGKINMDMADNVIHIVLTVTLCIAASLLGARFIISSQNHVAALIIIAGMVICVLALHNKAQSKEIDNKNRKIYESERECAAVRADLQTALDCHRDANEMLASLSSVRATLVETQQQLSQAKSQLSETLNQMKRAETCRYRIENAPRDITFAEDGEPVYWLPDEKKPYGDYTAFLNRRSKIYHTDRYCAPYDAETIHIFHAIDRFCPCRKCAATAFPFTTVPDWYHPK